MRGPSQFQQLPTLSPPFPGKALREVSPSAPLRDSRAGQRLPKGPLWPFTGSPQDEQHAGLRLTDGEGEEATGAVAQAEDIIGEGEVAGTTETVAVVLAAGAVAGMGAIEADARVEEGANEAEAGIVAAGTVAGIITGAEEEVGGVVEAGVACLAAW